MGFPSGFCAVCVFGISPPERGLAKAQGLNQCCMFFVLVAQVVPGLVGSCDPPLANGSRLRSARRDAPLTPGLLGLTVNGVPVWATKTRSVAQPPTSAFRTPPWFR